VRVFDGLSGARIAEAFSTDAAFGRGYRGGVFVAAGDVNGDGSDDVMVGATSGSGWVRIFSGPSVSPVSFDALPGVLRGVRLAAMDANADGIADIIATRATGEDNRVRLFSGTDLKPLPEIRF
jgi:hypothetical protein